MWYLKDNDETKGLIVVARNFFNEEEVNTINKLVKPIKLEEAKIGLDDANSDEKIRSNKIKWITPSNSESDWIFRRYVDLINDVNNNFYQFTLEYIEDLQYTIYKGSKKRTDYYTAHIDDLRINKKINVVRKLSVSTVLSDESGYEGGDLIIYDDSLSQPKRYKLNKGDAIIFPSFLLHEVEPIISGTRISLVCWAHGPSWK